MSRTNRKRRVSGRNESAGVSTERRVVSTAGFPLSTDRLLDVLIERHEFEYGSQQLHVVSSWHAHNARMRLCLCDRLRGEIGVCETKLITMTLDSEQQPDTHS